MVWIFVVGPLVLYATLVLARAALGRAPRRFALNAETSLLLAGYYLATAGLGVFWVANQQLPPFDWHYLFGYATVALVGTHLYFNLPSAFRHFSRRTSGAGRPPAHGRGTAVRVAGVALALGAAYFLGMRAGPPRLSFPSQDAERADAAHAVAVREYHAFSSHSRAGVLARAPSVSWGAAVPAHHDRSGLPTLALAPPDPDHRAGARLDLRDVAALVWATAGITERRGGVELRAAASSGALFPTEVYVAAWDVEGLSAGVYAYVPSQHALARLPAPPLELAAIGAPEAAAAGPPLALIATSVFRRTGQKYRDRAYRYATADAGHALGNTVAAARFIGLTPSFAPRFDEARLGAALGLDADEEGPLALLSIRAPGASPTVAAAPLAPAPLADPRRLPLGVTSFAHLATSLRLVIEPGSAAANAVALEPAPPAALDVLRLFATRRSVRTYAARPLTRAELGSVLATAVARAPQLLSRAVRVHVVASRVEPLAPGIYRYDARGHALELARAGAFAREAGSAALDQSAVGDAPAVIVLGVQRSVLEQEGARGYRQAFIEAGMIGARLYLAAASAGLGGCAVGAFYDDEAARLLSVDLAAEWPIHFFALGAPT